MASGSDASRAAQTVDRMSAVPLFATDRVTDAAGRTILIVSGDVDLATADHFFAAAEQTLRSHADAPLLLDLGGVTFIDSTGVTALLNIRRAAKNAGTNLEAVRLSDVVSRVLAIAGIAELFDSRGGAA